VKGGIAADLVTALTSAEDRRAELLSRRTERDPEVVLVTARIAELQQQIHSLVSTYLAGLTDQVAALDSVLYRADATLGSIPAKEVQLAELERNVKGDEDVFSMLQSRLKEAEIAAAASDQSVRLVDPAILPEHPISPKPLLNLALAIMAGAMLGLGAAFFREHADRSLHTRRELLVATGVPVLGIMPRLRTRQRLPGQLARLGWRSRSGNQVTKALQTMADLNGGPPQTNGAARARLGEIREHQPRGSGGSRHGMGTSAAGTFFSVPRSTVSDMDVSTVPERSQAAAGADSGARMSASETENLFVFREAAARLATNLAFLVPQQPSSVLLITSALRGDGKTTVSTNVALAMARAGYRVLLIDADLRGGTIGRLLTLPHRQGLTEVLAGRVEVGQVLVSIGTWGNGELHVIGAGETTDTPAELLGSSHTRALVEWSRATYDITIIDTPPVASVADAAGLVPLVDGVVLIARAGVTARDALAFAVEQLRIVRAPVLGAVLNDVDFRRDAAYDSTYQYYVRYTGAAV
jgi:capsular exopolysaccharide synthesis family protein